MTKDVQRFVDMVRGAATGRPIVGVMGGGREVASADAALATGFARAVSAAGVAVLTGGGPGIMAAASEGAAHAIGVLPGLAAGGGYPNQHVDHPIFTGLGTLDRATGDPGRNLVNVLASDVVVACRGAAGTCSEIRLAVEHEKPLALLGWTLDDVREIDADAAAACRAAAAAFTTCERAEEAARWVIGRLDPGDRS